MKCSLGISNFLEEISSLSHSVVFSISLHWSLKKAFLSLLAILWNCAFRCLYLSFSPLLPDLHIGFSRGRSGGLVFPSLSEFSAVYCDPHSQRLTTILPYNPAIPLLGIHTEETRVERDTCTPVFIAALFTIARTWKQPRCSSADEWIRKLWYINTIECCSAIKKNTFELVLMRWMKLEPIIHSEVSQKEKHRYSILTHIYEI